MKTILTMMFAFMVCLATSNNSKNKTNDPYHLVIEGQFLAEKNIHYTIYKEDKTSGKFISESRNEARKYYSVVLDKGCKYIIRFQDKKGNTKFLMVDAIKAGYFETDVDFDRSHDAKIQYTKNGYSLTPITKSKLNPDLLAKN